MKTKIYKPAFPGHTIQTPRMTCLERGLSYFPANLPFSQKARREKVRSFALGPNRRLTGKPSRRESRNKRRATMVFSGWRSGGAGYRVAAMLFAWLILSCQFLTALPQPENPSSSVGKISPQTSRESPSAKISLAQAIQEALMKDPLRRNFTLEGDRLGLEARQIARQKLFSVAAAGNYLYKSQTIFLELPTAPGLTSSLTTPAPFQRIEAGLKHNYDFGLSLSQPIFTGGRLSNSAAIYEVGQLVASTEASLFANEIATNVKTLYFQYRRLQAKKNALLALREQLSLHEKKTASLVEAHLARRLNWLETRIKSEELEANLLDLEQAIAATRISFQSLCGHFPEEVEEGYSEPELTWEEAVAAFEKNHPQFKIYQARLTQLELQKRVARASNLPQVAGVFETHYGKPGINFFKREWSFYAQAGLSLQFRLFDWQQARAEIEILGLEEQKIRNEQEDFSRKTTQELARLFEQKKLLIQKIQHLENIVRLAEEEVKLKELLAEENLLPHIDYLTALWTRKQNKWQKDEAWLALEEIKVRINGLVGWFQPEFKK